MTDRQPIAQADLGLLYVEMEREPIDDAPINAVAVSGGMASMPPLTIRLSVDRASPAWGARRGDQVEVDASVMYRSGLRLVAMRVDAVEQCPRHDGARRLVGEVTRLVVTT